VTTSSIEAKLLALSQTAKEAIFTSSMFKATERALDYQMRQHADAPTDYGRHGKANHEALTR